MEFFKGLITMTPDDLKSIFHELKELLVRIRLPKIQKGRVGIVVAIKTENDKELIKLQSGLVDALQMNIQQSELRDRFQVMSLPQHHVSKISDRISAEQVLRGMGGHFMVYGGMIEQQHRDSPHYVFRLEGVVVHRPIEESVSKIFSREFAELLPRRFNFPESEEMLGFELTHQWLGIAAKYIIGIAAFLSWDFDLSLRLQHELNKEVMAKLESSQGLKTIRPIREIKKRIPLRIIESCSALCTQLYFQYAITREKQYIQQQKPYLDLLKQYDPNDYSSGLSRAIYFFLVDKNVDEAKQELRRIEKISDVTWRYSLAFLYAYEGRLSEAQKEYDRAFDGYTSTPNIINDVEIFISETLQDEPDKIQLYFARGYLNFKGKGDLLLAKEDFESFLKNISEGVYQEQVRLSREYIKQLTS